MSGRAVGAGRWRAGRWRAAGGERPVERGPVEIRQRRRVARQRLAGSSMTSRAGITHQEGTLVWLTA
jgi:hypothetical protein